MKSITGNREKLFSGYKDFYWSGFKTAFPELKLVLSSIAKGYTFHSLGQIKHK